MQAERLLPPKEISGALFDHFGLPISPDYVRAIRRQATRQGAALFVGGMARASEVFAWLRDHPEFRVREKCAVGPKKKPKTKRKSAASPDSESGERMAPGQETLRGKGAAAPDL